MDLVDKSAELARSIAVTTWVTIAAVFVSTS